MKRSEHIIVPERPVKKRVIKPEIEETPWEKRIKQSQEDKEKEQRGTK